MNALAEWNGKQLDLIRRTVAKDTTAAEFDLFIHTARHLRLDPLRRQIYVFVFGRVESDKRKMAIVTAIDGYRTIAARTGNYRPDDKAPVLICDPSKANAETNPLGIERCQITVYKHAHGEWFPVVGEAYWDEFAPIKEIWENERPTGRFRLDPKKDNWRKMPRVMIAKCAEAQAIRRAWPDDVGGSVTQEEIDRQQVMDLTASEMVDAVAAEAKLALVGGKDALTVDWCNSGKLERIAVGRFSDSVLAWARNSELSSTDLRWWWSRNEAARSEFKAKHGSEYFDLQRAFEHVTNERERQEVTQAAE